MEAKTIDDGEDVYINRIRRYDHTRRNHTISSAQMSELNRNIEITPELVTEQRYKDGRHY